MAFGLRAVGGVFGFAAVLVGVAACSPSVVVDAGKTAGATSGTTSGGGASGQGGGATTTGTGTGTGTGGGTTTSTSSMCPDAPPIPGSACAGDIACSYGGGDCPVMFACIGGQWAQAGDCPQPACPAYVPASGEPCSHEGQECVYEHQCSGDTAICEGGAWIVASYGPACEPWCPEQPPSDGAYCDVCCTPPYCEYAVEGCFPTQTFCVDTGNGGVWKVVPGGCEPPPMPACEVYGGSKECEADPGCRWLVPGCGVPSLPAEGCFPKAECTDGFDCGMKTCSFAIVDPCWNKGCNACAAEAAVCLP
jgi:hypothetical protein